MALEGTRAGITELNVRDIDDLFDVAITSPTNGQTVQYDASNNRWVNASAAGGVTSVAVSGGAGITVAGSPITGSGTISLGLSNVARTNAANTFSTGTQEIRTGNDATVGVIIKGNSATQSANLQEWQTNAGTIRARIDKSGYFSMPAGGTGVYNQGFGPDVLTAITSGSYNSAFGEAALQSVTAGNYNIAYGGLAAQLTTTGEYNVAIGHGALGLNVTGGNNVSIGAAALYNNTNNYNIGIGAVALYANTNGQQNTAIGYYSLAVNTTGNSNVAIGSSTLPSNTTGSANVAIGQNCLFQSTSDSNIGIGGLCAPTLQIGAGNVFIGQGSDSRTAICEYAIGLGFNAKANTNHFAISPYVSRMSMQGLSSTLDIRDRGDIRIAWIDDTDASRKARMTLGPFDTAFREAIRMDSDGSRALVGLGGTTPTAILHLPAGSATANTGPLKMTSGTLLTTPEVGAIEFLNDDFYTTITTSAARKKIVLDDGTALTSGRVPFATTNGRLTDDADMTFATDTLTVAKMKVKAGTSSAYAKIGGVIFDNYVDVVTSGAAETDLYSNTLGTNMLATNGDKIDAKYAGLFAATLNNKQLKAYFGGTAIFDSGSLAITSLNSWELEVLLIRTDTSAARCTAKLNTSSATLSAYAQETDLTNINFAANQILKITGTGTANNDITAKLGFGEWKAAA